jgi:hypothetical protein
MLKFIFEKRRITVDPMSLSLSYLKDIWISDPSPNKEEAIRLLTYIHLASQIDQSAPFCKADYKEVGSLVKKELYGNYDYRFTKPFTESQIEEFITNYQLAYETPEEATVRAFDNKIHEIRKLVETTPIEIEKVIGKSGVTFISNFSILNSMMKDITKITAARDEMRAMVIKHTARETGKGNRKKSFLEKRRREMQESRVLSRSVSKDEQDEQDEQDEEEPDNL